MSRGSTEANGFPCPQCGKRSRVTKSLPAEAGTFRRYRKCASGCRGFWTTERVDGTHPDAPARKRIRVTQAQINKRFAALNERRRGLLWRIMQLWREEDAASTNENGERNERALASTASAHVPHRHGPAT